MKDFEIKIEKNIEIPVPSLILFSLKVCQNHKPYGIA